MHAFYLDKFKTLIPVGSRILDLGCGNGDLLQALKQSHSIQGYGIDIKNSHVLSCLKKGLSIYHGSIEDGIRDFQDHSFDVVILSQTLQQIQEPLNLLNEIVRVGKKAIITFPNFGYWRMRLQLLKGKAPRSVELPYTWYNTPNIRVITTYDFIDMCRSNRIRISEQYPLFPKYFKWLPNRFGNLLASKAMFIIERDHDGVS